MTFKERYYNKDTLNIFVDASIKKWVNEVVGCPGALAIHNGKIIDSHIDTLRYSTNNNSEITAIYYGLLLAIKYRDKFKYLNLFSDSKICVFGLTRWIFNWIDTIKADDDINKYTEDNTLNCLYGSGSSPVANQSEIMLVIQTILAYNLRINIYHQRGHININNESMLKKARACFARNNNIDKDELDLDIIADISKYNNLIDGYTRNFLGQRFNDNKFLYPAMHFLYNKDTDMEQYSKLLNISSLK